MDNEQTKKSYVNGYFVEISSDERRCTIFLEESQQILCNSLDKLNVLCNLIISPSYDKLSFLINSIKPLSQVMNKKHKDYRRFCYSDGITMAKNLGFQIFYLEQDKQTLSWLNMNNIYVINETYYIYLGVKELVDIHQDEKFSMFSPIIEKRNIYLAPELTSISSIPANFHKNAVYYSLAQIIVVCLMPDQDKYKGNPGLLFPIVDTSLYWFLIRCFRNDPKSRVCLLF